MKSFLHNLMSFAMASLMLFVTTSFALNIHFCGDSLVDFSFTHDTRTCGMEAKQIDHCGNEISEKSCCTDKQIVVDGQDDLQITVDKISFGQQVFVAALFYTYVTPATGSNSDFLPFKHYKPPIPIREIYKLHETYII